MLQWEDEEDREQGARGPQIGTVIGVVSRTATREALALLKYDPSRFDLVITDQTMPDMTGVELAREILAIRQEMPVILCTGFSHLVDADSARERALKVLS